MAQDRIERLKEIASLYENKLITKEEYEKLKTELLSDLTESNESTTQSSKEEKTEQENTENNSKETQNDFGKIVLTDKSFMEFKQAQNVLELEKNEIVDSTAHCQNGDLIIPSIYLLGSSELEFNGSLAIPGIFFSLMSLNKSIKLCLEEIGNPYIKYFRPEKNRYAFLLNIDRSTLLSFEFKRNEELTAVKPKQSYQFIKNLGPAAPIGGLIGNLLTFGGAKLMAKMQDDTHNIKGDIFVLTYLNHDKTETITIGSERNNSPAFLIFLRKHWKTEIPQFQEQPYTFEEFKVVEAELLLVGDKVRIPRFFGYDEGLIVKKEKTEAIVKTVKNGIEKEEAIRYSKLTLLS